MDLLIELSHVLKRVRTGTDFSRRCLHLSSSVRCRLWRSTRYRARMNGERLMGAATQLHQSRDLDKLAARMSPAANLLNVPVIEYVVTRKGIGLEVTPEVFQEGDRCLAAAAT